MGMFFFPSSFLSQNPSETDYQYQRDPGCLDKCSISGILLRCANEKRASLQAASGWEGVGALG